jgi:hypothetical protein
VHVEPGDLEPGRVRLFLRPALRRVEAGAEDLAVEDQCAVGGEDHVGQFCVGLHGLDLVAESAVGVGQGVPLGPGEVLIDLGVLAHPRIDGVLHVEVTGFADQVTPGARHAAGWHPGFLPIPEMAGDDR